MGKIGGEEEQALPNSDDTSHHNAEINGCCGCRFGGLNRVIGFKCLFVLLLSVAVFLSAVFWLPPFFKPDDGDLDLDLRFRGHDIVASFNVRKSVTFLEDNIMQLEDDIFYELSSPSSTKVVILYLEPSASVNITKVVFGVDPYAKYLKLSSLARSLIRANFELLVVNQSLRLTRSVFGDPFSFEVLKFPGGITIIPPQSAFLLQKVQIRFNFTLNFSIYQIQINFAELTAQLKSGIHLASYENLYISLSNSKGSTVAPPTVVQSSVVLAVGTPSMGRLRQLTQTIRGQSRNLGLNNTVFGKVKQVRLSSVPQHSSGGSPSPSPSLAPIPPPHHNHHHHHHHHHHSHHHHHDASPAPAISRIPGYGKDAPTPAPAHFEPSPAPLKRSPAPHNSRAKAPGCHNNRSPGNSKKHSHLAPMVAPSIPPHFVTPSPSPKHHVGLPPTSSPPPISESIPVSGPLPNVIYAHAQPPSTAVSGHSDTAPSVSPLPSLSPSSCYPNILWVVSLSLYLVFH
ncbi:zinc finger (C3HC4-type RING finger) family protein [Euphorbia peplus]|nr:zinc finger (C3HC4-type RING finger) family protein [Euphorbia peplus]